MNSMFSFEKNLNRSVFELNNAICNQLFFPLQYVFFPLFSPIYACIQQQPSMVLNVKDCAASGV